MIHAWHETQLSGLLLVPFMKALLFMLDGTEEIILAFRILYTVIWWLASVFLFCHLKHLSIWGALLASICFFFFSPLGIIALSFYSMGLLLFLLTCILITFSHGRGRLFLAGFLLAGAVLCNPYLVFLWLAFSLVAFIDRLSFHKIPKGYWFLQRLESERRSCRSAY